MDWLNIHSSTIDGEAYQDATPAQRGTWLNLLRYCCGQENGGVIRDASRFSDRKWIQLAGVTKAEVDDACDLWSIDGDDLELAFYPLEKEGIVKQKRLFGSSGGRARASSTRRKLLEAHAKAPAQAYASSTESDGATSTAIDGASTEGKGREEKGKEEEENARAHEPLAERREAEANIPSETEFRDEFMDDAMPADWLHRQFEWFHEQRAWLTGRGVLTDWPRIVRNRWVKDRAGWVPEKKPAATQTVTLAALREAIDI